MTWHKKFFALLLILLPTQLGFHFWPEWAMVLGRRIDYLSPTLYLTDIIIFFILLFWFIESRPTFGLQKLFPVLLFAAVNVWVSRNQPEAIYKWLKVAEFGLLGFYIVRTKPRLNFVIRNLSFGIFYSSLIAIGQFVLQHSIGGPLWVLGERTFTIDTPGIARIALGGQEFLRAYGTFPHPNVLGGFLAVTLPFLLNLKKSRWYALCFGLGVVALSLTFSRSAWTVAFLGILLTINKKFLLLLVAVLVIVLARVNLGEESVVVRQQLQSAALSLWQQSPLVGVGLGNFLVRLPEVLASRQIYFLQPVHNIYLLLLAETGIIGFIMVLLLLRRTIKKLKIPLIALLLLGFIDHYPLTLQQGQLLFTLLLALSLI
ncbi:O-antigen ligase family protein [Candidatus Gottesmanbacteria bacterium]|nr:O-antigen ligase family protein [Candidatus Gottesmanbacteria bacterium]